jgi:nucleoside-diphosphate-sugar epimerase
MKTDIVLGGAGFVGRTLTEWLTNRDRPHVVMDIANGADQD